MKEATYNEVLKLFRGRIGVDCRQIDLAREFGVTPAFISQVVNQVNGSAMTPAMLASVGYEKVVTYRRIKQ